MLSIKSELRSKIELTEGLQCPPTPEDKCIFEGTNVMCKYDGFPPHNWVFIGTIPETHGVGYGEVFLRSSGNGVEIPAILRASKVPVAARVRKTKLHAECKAPRSHAKGALSSRNQSTIGRFFG